MEKLEIINLYDKDVVLNINLASKDSRTIGLVGGHLYLTLKPSYNLHLLKVRLEKVFDRKKIHELNSSFYITPYYVDVLGERKRLVDLSKGQKRISKEDFVVENEKDLQKKIKTLAKDIITSRVIKYQKIMSIPVNYQVKITNMRSSIGKNYYQKKLLTFDHNLIHYSLEIIDSVVIHELAHYFIQNHSPEFYKIVLNYMPNYRKIRKKLIIGERQ
ncbi:MAG: M48 family metallopeptidase [Erysipelotrichaceae bacterium]|nr:M48 family metallopeptidase [Erysipelotrichaceae bacterium]